LPASASPTLNIKLYYFIKLAILAPPFIYLILTPIYARLTLTRSLYLILVAFGAFDWLLWAVRRDRKNWGGGQIDKSDVLGTSPFCTDAGDQECCFDFV
jgi:hypothetical protein